MIAISLNARDATGATTRTTMTTSVSSSFLLPATEVGQPAGDDRHNREDPGAAEHQAARQDRGRRHADELHIVTAAEELGGERPALRRQDDAQADLNELERVRRPDRDQDRTEEMIDHVAVVAAERSTVVRTLHGLRRRCSGDPRGPRQRCGRG